MNKTRVVTRRRLALLAATSLAVVTIATPAPAQAVSGVIVTQSTPIYFGVPDYRDSGGPAMTVAAGVGGAADEYPSTIVVPDNHGTVSDVTVDLLGLLTENLESLHVLLVAPDGRRALLLGHAGGANGFNGSLSLDDDQPAVIPDDGPVPAPNQVRPSSTRPLPPHPHQRRP